MNLSLSSGEEEKIKKLKAAYALYRNELHVLQAKYHEKITLLIRKIDARQLVETRKQLGI